MIERCPDVSEHDSACQRCCNRAESEIPLCGRQQTIAVTCPQTRFESTRKIRGRLYGRKVSEQQEGPTDLGVMLCAALTLSEMPLHANQLDPGQGIVYESNVLITKLTTIHGVRWRVR